MRLISLDLAWGPEPAIAAPVFRTEVVPVKRRWPAMLISLASHGIILALLPVLSDQMRSFYADNLDWSKLHVEMINLRVPGPTYYEAPREKGTNEAANLKPSLKPGKSGPARDAAPRTAQHPASASLNGIALPKGDGTSAKTTVLQPDVVPDRVHAGDLPSLAFWARGNRPVSKPRAEVVVPGRAEQAAPPPRLASAPVLAVPNMESNPGDRNIAAAPQTSNPSLSATPSSTAPIRDRESDPATGSFDWQSGQAVNVIALAAERPRSNEIVVIPRTSQLAGLQRDTTPGGMSGSLPPGSTGNQGTSPVAGTGAGRNAAALYGASSDHTLAAANPAFVRANGNTAASGPSFRGAEASIRIMHPPAGNFDVVVQRSAERDESPEFGVALTGSPVYTVYLSVGDQKDWVLEFCLPAQESRNTQYQVFVDKPKPLTAPYPVTTSIPKTIVGEPRTTPTVFHAFLTASGTFRDIKAVQGGSLAAKVASLLSEWIFRPAKRDGQLVEVEVLLVVPPVFETTQARPARQRDAS